MAHDDSDHTVTNIYGSSGSDVVTYTVTDAAIGDIIDNEKFKDLYNHVDSERGRRGHSVMTHGVSNYDTGDSASVASFNAIVQGLIDAGGSGELVASANIIKAAHINGLIDNLQSAGAACVCNCNYCTCNCNYCTCNCNYCTCNCNYCTCNCNYCTCNCNYACTCNCNY